MIAPRRRFRETQQDTTLGAKEMTRRTLFNLATAPLFSPILSSASDDTFTRDDLNEVVATLQGMTKLAPWSQCPVYTYRFVVDGVFLPTTTKKSP